MSLIDLSPAEVAARLAAHEIVLIDVREPNEHAAERIDGAILMPLSSFDPAQVPQDPNRPVVFHCARGGRSAQAVQRCRHAGLTIDSHLAGGIVGWKAAGLPVETKPPHDAPSGIAGLFNRIVGR
jgi:rhodanese-related sulfurtransferase